MPGLLAALTYLFLYAPILVLVALSFNESRLSAAWGGFTLAWYTKAARDPAILSSLRNSLLVGFATTVIATAAATAAALAFHRHRFRRQGVLEGLLTIPTVAPEIVLAASLLLLFAAAGLRLGFLTVILAHVSFTVSYAFVVVRARIAGLDHSLEEAAM
ncbi:MAG TPA: ABC transporter permease, partial [Vicinamibacteria bacterium]|nr:ABC transporter permease [Vicinamibacteria bacterium]